MKLGIFGQITHVNDMELNRFVIERPAIEEFDFGCYPFQADVVIMLTSQMGSLKRFRFSVKDRSECDRFEIQLDNKWQRNVHTSSGTGSTIFITSNL